MGLVVSCRESRQAVVPHWMLWAGLVLAATCAVLLAAPSAQAQCSGGPANNCFANPIVVGATPFTNTQSNAGATMEAGEPSNPCNPVGATVWYQWTPSVTGTVVMTTLGSNYDTMLAVYTGSTVGGLTQIACNDDNPSAWPTSIITFTCQAGVTYRIQLGGWQPSSGPPSTGTAQLNVGNCIPPPPPGCGYSVTNIPLNWDDITAPIGTSIAHGDLTSLTVNLNTQVSPPMPFTFCDTVYTSLRLVSKGYICLGTAPVNCAGSFGACCAMPSTSLPRPAIFGYFADIYPGGCQPSGGVSCTFWKVLGNSPNRRFVYEFRNVPNWPSSSPGMNQADTNGPLTFEIKLFEATNCIEVHYKVINPGNGARVEAGYQNAAGTAYYAFWNSAPGFNTVGSPGPAGSRAWRACPVPPFDAVDDAYTFNEDQAGVSLPVTANDNNAVPGGVTITGMTAPSKGTLALDGANIIYTPNADRNGLDTFTYTIRNANNQNDTARVNITINPLNDVPTFTLGSREVVAAPKQGPQLRAGVATGVAAAPATATDEAGQAVTFLLESNSGQLIFNGVPTLSRSTAADAMTPVAPPTFGTFGLLAFAPSGAYGLSEVCYRAVDDGGVDTGTNSWGVVATGIDRSEPLCITIVENGPPSAYFETSTELARPGQSVTFNPCPAPPPRCSSDPNDGIVRYLWEFGDGAASDMVQPGHPYDRTGGFLVRLSVFDGYGGMGFFERTVAVDWPGAAPVRDDGSSSVAPPKADAGPEATVLEGTRVRLAGSQTGGGEGTTFAWTQLTGPKVTLSNTSAPSPTFMAPELDGPVSADLVFSLKVADGGRESIPDYVTIKVESANTAPVADAGGPLSATVGLPVQLDGSGSLDPDGDPLTYRWEQVYSEGDEVVALAPADGMHSSFTAPERTGILRFRLEVSDGEAVNVDEAVVIVQPPMARAGPSFSYLVLSTASGTQVQFQAGPGVRDPRWSFPDGTTAQGHSVSRPFEVGTWQVTMSDGEGDAAPSVTQDVEVETLGLQGNASAQAGPAWLPYALLGACFSIVGGVATMAASGRRHRARPPSR